MSTTIDDTIENAGFKRAVAEIKQNVETATAAQTQASERAWKTGKELAALNQGMMEAYVQAGQIYAEGSQNLFRQMTESSQAAFVETLNGFRAFVSAKTAKERVSLQANFVRSAAVRAVAESSRFANASIELAEKVAAPITTVTVTAAESLSFPKL